MANKAEEALSAGAGLVAVLVVGVAVLAARAEISADPAVVVAWWAAYLVYLAVFLTGSELIRRRPPWPPVVSVVVMFVTASVLWLLAPHLGWTALLPVVTTAVAAFDLSSRAVVALVAAQTVIIPVGGVLAGWEADDVVFQTLAYLAFQVFAALVVTTARREATARAELAAAHADLHAATALLATSSREAERLRIARDLHDVLGHQLTALALELEVASHRTDGPGRDHVLRARDIAKDLLGDVRSTVGELRDTRTGLEPTLRDVVERLGLTVDLRVVEHEPLDDARRLAVVRAVQEVATNTARHSGAARLEVEVVSDDHGLMFRAHDDGAGVRRIVRGNGLRGMAERFEDLGGELEVESGPGRGFTVTARVPAP
ncbi:sensor histidine kinase [Tessaracoccus sp. G1721]